MAENRNSSKLMQPSLSEQANRRLQRSVREFVQELLLEAELVVAGPVGFPLHRLGLGAIRGSGPLPVRKLFPVGRDGGDVPRFLDLSLGRPFETLPVARSPPLRKSYFRAPVFWLSAHLPTAKSVPSTIEHYNRRLLG